MKTPEHKPGYTGLLFTLFLLVTSCSLQRYHVDFYTDKEEVILGDTLTFSWNIADAPKDTWVRLRGVSGKFRVNDSVRLIPKEDERYFLYLCKNDRKIYRKSKRISVIKPQMEYFIVEPSRQVRNGVSMKWKMHNIDCVKISGVDTALPPEGELLISSRERLYTIKGLTSRVHVKQQVVLQRDSLMRPFIQDKKMITDILEGVRMSFEIMEVDHSSYPRRVNLKVAAIDQQGNYIGGLAPPYGDRECADKYFKSVIERFGDKRVKKDFKVREIRENYPNPSDIVLTLDYSGSMSRMINEVEDAAKAFIASKHQDDRMAVVKFDHHLDRQVPLLYDPDRIIKQTPFEGIKGFGGSTALYAAWDEGMKLLLNSPQNRERVVVLFTDGYENASFAHQLTHTIAPSLLAYKMKQNNIKLITVAMGRNVNKELLSDMALLSNGSFYQINQPGDMKLVLAELSSLMKNYYRISYVPGKKEKNRDVELVYYNNDDGNEITDKPVMIESRDKIKFAKTKKNKVYDSLFNINTVMPPQVAINFNFDKWKLTNEEQQRLVKYAAYLLNNRGQHILLIGHTDQKGSDKYNLRLSGKRARQIKEYLVGMGVPSSRIQVKAMGFRHPVWVNEDQEWKARENRRVEAVFHKPDKNQQLVTR